MPLLISASGASSYTFCPRPPVWSLDPQVLDGLAKAVELIAERANGVRLQALWIGEGPDTQERVSLKQLLRAIRDNAIKNKHVYLVGGAG